MKKIKKLLALLIALLFMFGVISACGKTADKNQEQSKDQQEQPQQNKEEENEGVEEPKKEEKASIRYAFWGAQSDIDLTEYRIDKFKDKFSEIDVELVHIPDPYEDKLLAMIAGGNAPDVMTLYEVTTPVFAEQGTIQDLIPFIEKDSDFDLDDFFPNVLEMAKYNDGLYGLGSDFNPQVLYYNKTLFDEADVSYPTIDWTWDDYLDAARKLTKEDGSGKTVQWGSDALGNWWVPNQIAIWQNGGQIFNEDRTESLFDSPEVIDALQWQADLVLKEKVAPTPAQSKDLGDMFMTGKVAMTRTGTWMIRPYEEITDFEWDIAPIPKKKEAATVIHTAYITMSKDTQFPEASFELIKHLSSVEMQTYMAENIRFLPQRKSAFEKKPFIKEGVPPENVKVLEEVIAVGRMLPSANNIKQITDLFQAELEAIYSGDKTAEQSMKEFSPKVDELLNKK